LIKEKCGFFLFTLLKLFFEITFFGPLACEGKNLIVPDHGSRDRVVVLVRCTINLGKPRGVRNLGQGGNGEGRSVYDLPGAKVDRIAARQRKVSK
jgi:hypothetical protein